MFARDQGASAPNRHDDSHRSDSTESPARREAGHKAALKKLAEIAHRAELPAERGGLPPRIARFLAANTLPSPCLVVDVDMVEHFYLELERALPPARIFYAVKANPAEEVIARLERLGADFDIASVGEIDICLRLGIAPERISFGNTIKKQRDIAAAFARGVRIFAFDSEAELQKIAESAPGAKVFCRMLVDCDGAEWPLSRKFGCEPGMTVDLLVRAQELGLDPYGVTFHVGSQCTDPVTWRRAIASMGRLLDDLSEERLRLELLNMSGGFPARYEDPVPDLEEIAAEINSALDHLPYVPTQLAAEPGRYLVAESSVLAASVLGREVRAGESWIYLDVGAYNGLIETKQTTKWRYPLWSSRADHSSAPHDSFTVTGPTCDSSDTLFVGVPLPSTMDVGDQLYIGSTGAYTLSYASSFNGFPPPRALYVGR